MGVKLVASSGGSVELVPTNTASNFTLTVPAVTATMLTNKTAGTVLQVVQTAYTTVDSTTSVSPTMANTGCTASITPSSSTSKILVMMSMPTWHGNVTQNAFARIMRGSSAAFSGHAGDFWTATGTGICGNINIQWLDLPATTSSTTYTAQFCVAGGGTLYINKDYNSNNNGVTYLTLMEIAA